jgi:hypothetical protein
MIHLERDAGAAALIWALEEAAKAPNEDPQSVRSQLRIDRAMVALLRVHVADATVPELLRDPAIWNPVSRDGSRSTSTVAVKQS